VAARTFSIAYTKGGTNHMSISFDASKIEVYITNNGEGWDATVHATEKMSGKRVASSRTYGRKDVMEVNPGIYDLKVTALNMEGIETIKSIENVSVEPGQLKLVEHNFSTGIMMVGVKTNGELVDAVVKVIHKASNKNVAGSRTYTREGSNPTKFILNPGTYAVSISTLGKHKGHSEKFEMTVNAGQTVEKLISY
jgi:Ca-activated chloride channel family protein